MSIVDHDRFRNVFLLLSVALISLAFLAVIRPFVVTLLQAAIFAGLLFPLYKKFLTRLKGRKALSSLVIILVVFLPLLILLVVFVGMVSSDAVHVSQQAGPWLGEQMRQPSGFEDQLYSWIPFLDKLKPYRSQILGKVGEVAKNAGTFIVHSLSAAAKGTVMFFFHLFILLFAMFYFLTDGEALLEKILYYIPLSRENKERLLGKFLSVTRAILKGTILIGILQGVLNGIGFAVAGIPAAAFWGTVMGVFACIPGIGISFIWVPAVIYLLMAGKTLAGVLLAVWCGLLVGALDNFLRPVLIGKDAKVPTLFIFLGIFGGLVLFGAVGILLGPIVVALFMTIWEIYGTAYREILEKT